MRPELSGADYAAITSELCALIHGDRPGIRATIMMRLFCDESGGSGPNDPAFSVVGWLSPARQWTGFCRRWATVLKAYDVPAFRASEFESSKRHFQHGWDANTDREKRVAFLHDLGQVVKRHAGFGIGDFMWKPAYDREFGRHPRITLGRVRYLQPHVYLLGDVLFELCARLKSRPQREKIAVVFDYHQKIQGISQWFFEKWKHQPWGRRLLSLTFAKKEDVLPLQAADWVAYEIMKHFRNVVIPKDDGTYRGPRKPLEQLVAGVPVRARHLSPLSMRLHLRAFELGTDPIRKLA